MGALQSLLIVSKNEMEKKRIKLKRMNTKGIWIKFEFEMKFG